jgi:putative transposase
MGIVPDEVTAFGKSSRNVKARALLCYWTHRKLGMTATKIARRLKIGLPALSRLWRRGEQIENEYGFHLMDR